MNPFKAVRQSDTTVARMLAIAFANLDCPRGRNAGEDNYKHLCTALRALGGYHGNSPALFSTLESKHFRAWQTEDGTIDPWCVTELQIHAQSYLNFLESSK